MTLCTSESVKVKECRCTISDLINSFECPTHCCSSITQHHAIFHFRSSWVTLEANMTAARFSNRKAWKSSYIVRHVLLCTTNLLRIVGVPDFDQQFARVYALE